MKRLILCIVLSAILLLTSFINVEKTKPLSSTKFDVVLQKSYNLEEEFIAIVSYGTTKSIDEKAVYDPNAAILQVHYLDDKENDDIFNGVELYRVDNFLSKENEVSFKKSCGNKISIVYNQQTSVSIPKEYLNKDNGIICFSFICFSLDSDGNINPNSSYDGLNLYFEYVIKDNKILFSKL